MNFLTGAAQTFGPTSGYFTLASAGLSYSGADIFNIVTDPFLSLVLSPTEFTPEYNLYQVTTPPGSYALTFNRY